MDNGIIKGIVARFLEPNTDTDVIIPARFLKRTSLDGFEVFSFFEKRYSPETQCEPTLQDKDYIFQKKILNNECSLNHAHSKGATFLVTWCNFGCGSSREHAVYALNNYKVIIGSAPKGKSAFADIFRDNCRQNLIWTPVISAADHFKLNQEINAIIDQAPVELILDLNSQKLKLEQSNFECDFELPEHHFKYILEGQHPFEKAKNEIASVLTQVDTWARKHQALFETSPKTTA